TGFGRAFLSKYGVVCRGRPVYKNLPVVIQGITVFLTSDSDKKKSRNEVLPRLREQSSRHWFSEYRIRAFV
ncbi:MAG TPA: hypothetical protein VN114_13005, partial [Oxalicibacterium sp.]|uniref:hypothetical protein n=1 Tax=Oxalicibacterium sp. TaxID=2766525 RepID=UPI002C589B20